MNDKNENIPLKFDLPNDELDTSVLKEPENLSLRVTNDTGGGSELLVPETCNQINLEASAITRSLDGRSLDSISEYANKIRLFLGLSDAPDTDCTSGDTSVNSAETSEIASNEVRNLDNLLEISKESANDVDIPITTCDNRACKTQPQNILPVDERTISFDGDDEHLNSIREETDTSNAVVDSVYENNFINSNESNQNFSDNKDRLHDEKRYSLVNTDISNQSVLCEIEQQEKASRLTEETDKSNDIEDSVNDNNFINSNESNHNYSDYKDSVREEKRDSVVVNSVNTDISNQNVFSEIQPEQKSCTVDLIDEEKSHVVTALNNSRESLHKQSNSSSVLIECEPESNSVNKNNDIVNPEKFSDITHEEVHDGNIVTTTLVENPVNLSDINSRFSNSNNIDFEDEYTDTNTEKNKSNENFITHNVDLSETDSNEIPTIAAIRRLSTDIVTKVLDTAENQLKYIINNQRKSTSKDSEIPTTVTEEFAGENMKTKEKYEKIPNSDSTNFQQNGESEFAVLSDFSTFQPFKNYTDKDKDNGFRSEILLKDVLAKTYNANDFQNIIELEMNKIDPIHDLDPDTICGFGAFKPKWIQKYATARVYLVLYSLIGIISGSYYSYLISCLSTIEKRFAFKSKISGSIMVFDEITPLVLGVFVGYFGGKSHRPRMVGFGMFLASVSCFVSAVPYFIYGPATHLSVLHKQEKSVIDLCDGKFESENCDADSLPPTLAAVLFLMLGSFLKGFGNLAYYAIGLTYMDDNAKKKNTPIYFAVAIALRLLGPFLGFLMSTLFLKYHENPFGDPGFGPEDPRWIGGWWMGFMLQGVLLIIFTIPITLFPRRLPGHQKPPLKNTKEKGLSSNLIGLYSALKRLAKNPFFLLMNLYVIMMIFGNFGHYIMLPKYMENQFRLSASDASLFSGPPGIASVILSTLVGGYMIWKLRPSSRFLIGAMIGLEIVGVVGYLLLMIPRCEHVEMATTGASIDSLLLDVTCNENCNCSTTTFNPVCGADGKSLFYSPCYAGCKENLNHTFSNCSCVTDESGQNRDYVTDGFCVSDNCWSQALHYIIQMPIIGFITNLCKVTHSMLLLRCVHPEDKSVALGTFEATICLFGFIPYPVLFGALVDSACLVWETSCGKRGNCWHYDASMLNMSLHGVSAGFSAVGVLCLCALFYYSGRLGDLYEDDQETENLGELKQET